MSKEAISITSIGSTGFVGKRFVEFLTQPGISQTSITALQRSPGPSAEHIRRIVQGDHLDLECMREATQAADIVVDTAGLAWQHPGESFSTKRDLLEEQLLQNVCSTLVCAEVIQRNQKLVWTSTSAIDIMLARLSQNDKERFFGEVAQVVDQLTDFSQQERPRNSEEWRQIVKRVISLNPFQTYPSAMGKQDSVLFAEEYSYPYSKLLGQTVLERLLPKQATILKISDVYGPGQSLSQEVLDSHTPARRPQRFLAAYLAISEGKTGWIPDHPRSIHGFSKKSGTIRQTIWNDVVFPSYIDDVCLMIWQAIQTTSRRTTLDVAGEKITNLEMVQTIQKLVGTEVQTSVSSDQLFDADQKSQDLPFLGLSLEELTPFAQGVQEWIRWYQKTYE